MNNAPEPAKSRFRIKVLPAGRNDRVVEISDSGGHPLKYVHCPRRLGNSGEDCLDRRILKDWESMDADEFSSRYSVLEA